MRVNYNLIHFWIDFANPIQNKSKSKVFWFLWSVLSHTAVAEYISKPNILIGQASELKLLCSLFNISHYCENKETDLDYKDLSMTFMLLSNSLLDKHFPTWLWGKKLHLNKQVIQPGKDLLLCQQIQTLFEPHL